MKRKIVVKRLSASDLTLFEKHFRNTSGTKQKAFNLDVAIFVNRLYPGLPGKMDITRSRIPLDLSIFGPGIAGLHNLQRKILKQDKNWRLDGELIYNPVDEQNRYDMLQKGDFAIIEFIGDLKPNSARMHLIAQAVAEDEELFSALDKRYTSEFSARKGMVDVDPDELATIIGGLKLPDNHPVLDIADAAALEDAVKGGIEGVQKLRRRRGTRGVEKSELEKAKRMAEKTGDMGEELLNSWLQVLMDRGEIQGFKWNSADNAISPFDFSILNADGGIERVIDAKSTIGSFDNPIHVSLSELLEMADGGFPYDIYRLYALNADSAQMRIAEDLQEYAKTVLEVIEKLPVGVRVDSISINPNSLRFGDELTIDFSNQVDNES